jgi:hypothetical protein
VIRDQVLGLTQTIGELVDTAIAASELDHDLPTPDIADKLHEGQSGRFHTRTIHQISLMYSTAAELVQLQACRPVPATESGRSVCVLFVWWVCIRVSG